MCITNYNISHNAKIFDFLKNLCILLLIPELYFLSLESLQDQKKETVPVTVAWSFLSSTISYFKGGFTKASLS